MTGAKYSTTGALAEGKLFVAGDGVAALDPRTGEELWRFSTGSQMSSPCVYGGRVVAGCQDTCLYAVSADDGRKLWHFRADYVPSPTVDTGDGAVYFCDVANVRGSNSVYALDAADGRLLWRQSLSAGAMWGPTYADGVVYATSLDGRLHAVDAKSGRETWTYSVGGLGALKLASAAAVADGVVYYGAYDGTLHAVDARSGKKRWSFSPGYTWVGPPQYANGFVYFGCGNGLFYRVGAASGAAQELRLVGWEPYGLAKRATCCLPLVAGLSAPQTSIVADPKCNVGTPLVRGNIGYLGLGQQHLCALDLSGTRWRSGEGELRILWKVEGGWAVFPPVAHDVFVYSGATDGCVRCYADLLQIVDARHIDLLLASMTAPDDQVREVAWTAMARMADPNAVPLLTAALESGRLDDISSACIAVALGNVGARAKSAVPVLVRRFPVAAMEWRPKRVERTSHERGGGIIDYTQDEDGGVRLLPSGERAELASGLPILVGALRQRCGAYVHMRIPGKDPGTFYYQSDTLTLHGGAYALAKITGQDLGPRKSAWETWWQEKGKDYR
jgi:hypothetical protein